MSKETDMKIAAALALVAILTVSLVIGGLITQYFLWDVGVRGAAEAAGGEVGPIGLWTAVALNLILAAVTRSQSRGGNQSA